MWTECNVPDLQPLDYIISIVYPGIDGHFDPPCLNIHCDGMIGRKDFKLGRVIKKSYGFPFVGPISMEMLLTFELNVFAKILTIVCSR